VNFFENLISVEIPNIDEYETIDELDYADPLKSNGIPFVGNRSVSLALRANMKECWVDVFILFGLDKSGMLFNPINPDNSSMTHRVEVRDLKILKMSPSGEFVKKEKSRIITLS
jgi:hypothetical protein